MQAQALCAGIRRDLADVEERIKANSWLAELSAGRLSTGALRAFAGEQLQIIPSDLRSFEMLAQRFAADPAHDYFAGLAAGEHIALGELDAFAAAVGCAGLAASAWLLLVWSRTRPLGARCGTPLKR